MRKAPDFWSTSREWFALPAPKYGPAQASGVLATPLMDTRADWCSRRENTAVMHVSTRSPLEKHRPIGSDAIAPAIWSVPMKSRAGGTDP